MLHLSSWPVLIGVSVLGLVSSVVMFLKMSSMVLLSSSLLFLVLVIGSFVMDMLWEAASGGYSLQVLDNFKLSFVLLVFSEVMLFVSFFWTLFHFAFSPAIFLGHQWPPVGILVISPVGVPLLNTALLVSSGVTVTWFHHLLLSGSFWEGAWSLGITVFFGSLFLLNQVLEFGGAELAIGDSVYGGIFLVLTGFHGFHVFLGVFLLLLSGVRLVSSHFTCYVHVSVEASIWYWHFVDVIWLFVYSFIYCWGS